MVAYMLSVSRITIHKDTSVRAVRSGRDMAVTRRKNGYFWAKKCLKTAVLAQDDLSGRRQVWRTADILSLSITSIHKVMSVACGEIRARYGGYT
jgi:hypothetical protein